MQHIIIINKINSIISSPLLETEEIKFGERFLGANSVGSFKLTPTNIPLLMSKNFQ